MIQDDRLYEGMRRFLRRLPDHYIITSDEQIELLWSPRGKNQLRNVARGGRNARPQQLGDFVIGACESREAAETADGSEGEEEAGQGHTEGHAAVKEKS